ncbi:large subunit ribosomal protein L23, partial [Tremellales sp. Uapishka_1]
MATLFRRTLTSLSTQTAGPSFPPLSSSTSTLPQAVKRRRAAALLSPSPHKSSALPPKLEDEFQKLRANNQFKGDESSARKAFLARHSEYRSRIRGVSVQKEAYLSGEAESDEVVGQRIFLPNIQIRLMRNHTPPGEAYDPTIATFRIPPSMTKTDLRSYLAAVYNLTVTFIRTDNYLAPVARTNAKGELRKIAGSQKNYKRAVVGLKEAFHYPDDVEEMGEGVAAKERKEWLEEHFRLTEDEEMKKRARMKMYKGWRWRSKTHDNEGNTIREIMKRRAEREAKVKAEAEKMHAAGEVVAQ